MEVLLASAGGRSFSVLFPFLPGNKDIDTARESAEDGEVRLKDHYHTSPES